MFCAEMKEPRGRANVAKTSLCTQTPEFWNVSWVKAATRTFAGPRVRYHSMKATRQRMEIERSPVWRSRVLVAWEQKTEDFMPDGCADMDILSTHLMER